MGCDFGQWNEWNFDASLQWHLLQWDSHQGLQKCLADLNQLYRREKALHEVDFDYRGFEWIDCHNHEDSTLSYIRLAKDPSDLPGGLQQLHARAALAASSGRARTGLVSRKSSTATRPYYGGSNMGNGPGVQAEAFMSHGRPASIQVTLPPLATVVFKPRR